MSCAFTPLWMGEHRRKSQNSYRTRSPLSELSPLLPLGVTEPRRDTKGRNYTRARVLRLLEPRRDLVYENLPLREHVIDRAIEKLQLKIPATGFDVALNLIAHVPRRPD